MATTIAKPHDPASVVASMRHALGQAADWLVDRLRVPPPGLRTPPELAELRGEPVVLVVQLGTDGEAIRRTLEALPGLCSAAKVRVVLVVDQPDLGPARRSDVPVELLPDRDTWQRRHDQPSWSALVQHRLTIMRHDYAAATVIEAPEYGLRVADVPRLEAMLEADPHVRRLRAWWRRGVTAAVRLVDRPAVR